ncbi:MAG: threonine synthase [Bacilli bacterium]|nr:threonine synthase [Bacilli bacterium]
MSNVKHLECTICHRTYKDIPDMMTCPACGEKGILDVIYDYDKIRAVVDKDYFKHQDDHSIWRYLPFLPVDPRYTKNTLRVGMTPLYDSLELGQSLGIDNLYVKDEGLNPTQSLKDRASVIAVVKAKEAGYDTVACASTGNAASSLAGNSAKVGLSSVIFVPKRAPTGKLAQLLAYGAKLFKVDGDYRDTYELSKQAIAKYGWYNRNAAVNPFLVEGKKTVALEIAEQLDFDVPDWVVVSVGDGCTIAGVFKGFMDLFEIGMIERIPKLLGVQSEGCQPFVSAWESNEDLIPTAENTIADSIAVGIPRNPIKAIRAVKNSTGRWISVSDSAILEAMRLLGKTEGIFAEPAAACALAGLIKARKLGFINKSDRTVVMCTGNGLKDTANALSAFKEPTLVKNDISELDAQMR